MKIKEKKRSEKEQKKCDKVVQELAGKYMTNIDIPMEKLRDYIDYSKW